MKTFQVKWFGTHSEKLVNGVEEIQHFSSVCACIRIRDTLRERGINVIRLNAEEQVLQET